MNRRTKTSSWLLAGVVLLAATPMAQALDQGEARRIAESYLSLHPGDDIENDFRIVHVQAADLDEDGIEEILYAETSTCIGANFECTNGIRVLVANTPGTRPSHYDRMAPEEKRAFASGYVPVGDAFIPGDIRRVRVSGTTVTVDFEASEESSSCKRYEWTPKGKRPTRHCPPPGKYQWNFTWWRGAGLTRVDWR